MRRFLIGFLVAAIGAVIPALALADNQGVAEQVARNLRGSGQLSGYKIGVKCQDGTVWLRGYVTSQEQMKTAMSLVFQTPGVTRVVNELSLASAETSEPAARESQPAVKSDADNSATNSATNPLRGRPVPLGQKIQPQQYVADWVPNGFANSAIRPVSASEEVPQPMAAPPQAQPIPNGMVPMPNGMVMQPQMRGPMVSGAPMPMYAPGMRGGVAPARYDQPCMPNYAWPSYAAYPNYASVTYPKQYSPTAWPYIGPFYPYPQVPLGWRKVTLEWDSGWWFLDFKDQPASCWHR